MGAGGSAGYKLESFVSQRGAHAGGGQSVGRICAFACLCVCVGGGGIGGRIRPAHPTTHTPTRPPPPTTNHLHQPLTQIHQGMRGVGAQQRTLLSNRAAAYEKLGDLAKALDDCARILREVHFVVYIVVFGVVLMWFCRWFGGAFSVLSNH